MQGVDLIIHSAFMTANLKQKGEETYYNVNVEGTHHLADAAKRAGVKRAVVISGLGTKPDKPGSYMQGRYLAEEAFKESGMGWAMVQPSVQFGPHSEFFSGLANLIRQVPIVVPVAGSGKETFQPIWVEDVVTCVMKIVRDPAFDGQSYAIGGPEIYTYDQILDMLMGALHIQKIKVPGPTPLVMIGAGLMEAILPTPPITRAALGLFAFPNVTDLDSVQKHFGFTPMSWASYLAEHGA